LDIGIDLQDDLVYDRDYSSSLMQNSIKNKEGLLQTIYVPKVLSSLGNQLPKSNYTV